MKIFHGNTRVVENPDILIDGTYRDFGNGFYCYESSTYALKHALCYTEQPVVSQFEFFESDELKMKRFEKFSDEYIQFIRQCRAGIPHNYDVVIGPMIDENVVDYFYVMDDVNLTLRGVQEKLLELDTSLQIAFCTEKSMDFLKFEGILRGGWFLEEDEMDLYCLCEVIEYASRKFKQNKKYIVNKIGRERLTNFLKAGALVYGHQDIDESMEQWQNEFHFEEGHYDPWHQIWSLCKNTPKEYVMTSVYKNLILDTLEIGETFVDAMIRVYNHPICERLEEFNCSAYYEPPYVIAQAYWNNDFSKNRE